MSERELVIRQVTERMMEAFRTGNLIDAQNINAFIESLERMTDGEYTVVSSEGASGTIA